LQVDQHDEADWNFNLIFYGELDEIPGEDPPRTLMANPLSNSSIS
jgi:hypothetical protein